MVGRAAAGVEAVEGVRCGCQSASWLGGTTPRLPPAVTVASQPHDGRTVPLQVWSPELIGPVPLVLGLYVVFPGPSLSRARLHTDSPSAAVPYGPTAGAWCRRDGTRASWAGPVSPRAVVRLPRPCPCRLHGQKHVIRGRLGCLKEGGQPGVGVSHGIDLTSGRVNLGGRCDRTGNLRVRNRKYNRHTTASPRRAGPRLGVPYVHTLSGPQDHYLSRLLPSMGLCCLHPRRRNLGRVDHHTTPRRQRGRTIVIL